MAVIYPEVLVGDPSERVEMLAAGAEGLPPLRPIFVRPAVRLDPSRSQSRTWVRIRKVLSMLSAPEPTEIVCGLVIGIAVAYFGWQIARSMVAP